MNKKQAKKIVEWCNNSILMKNLSAKDYGTSYTKEKIDEAFCSLSPKYKKGFTKEKKKWEDFIGIRASWRLDQKRKRTPNS